MLLYICYVIYCRLELKLCSIFLAAFKKNTRLNQKQLEHKILKKEEEKEITN